MIKSAFFDFMGVVVSDIPGRRSSLKEKLASLYGMKVEDIWDRVWNHIYEMSIGKIDEKEIDEALDKLTISGDIFHPRKGFVQKM